MVRPSAAVAVGAVLCLDTASDTKLVPTTEITLTSWFADITRYIASSEVVALVVVEVPLPLGDTPGRRAFTTCGTAAAAGFRMEVDATLAHRPRVLALAEVKVAIVERKERAFRTPVANDERNVRGREVRVEVVCRV
jgi:hypothetical protein|tara:strand:- start:971 stop:1381 length:411 start_codon:yes stop_codon:yes gene_type:complete